MGTSVNFIECGGFMIKVIFKGLEKSSLAVEAAEEKLTELIWRFPVLRGSELQVTLSMENSPQQAGPDLFGVKVRVQGGQYHGVILEKKASSLYVALAEVSDHLLERLNRFSDKTRVKSRNQVRRLASRVN
jgi:ribosome-associated translation inhibitor RaiA